MRSSETGSPGLCGACRWNPRGIWPISAGWHHLPSLWRAVSDPGQILQQWERERMRRCNIKEGNVTLCWLKWSVIIFCIDSHSIFKLFETVANLYISNFVNIVHLRSWMCLKLFNTYVLEKLKIASTFVLGTYWLVSMQSVKNQHFEKQQRIRWGRMCSLFNTNIWNTWECVSF